MTQLSPSAAGRTGATPAARAVARDPGPADVATRRRAATGPGHRPGDVAVARTGGDSGVRNVFVVGLDEFNAARLQSVAGAATCRFLPLLERDEVRGLQEFDVERLLDEARRRLRASGLRVDAVCTYWDFPVAEMVSVLARELGVPGISLDSVVRVQHKYLSRLIQQQVAPESVPDFVAVDPWAPDPQIPIAPPYWLKPVRSFRSHLAYRIGRPEDLPPALEAIRGGISRLAEAYAPVLGRVRLPDEAAEVDGGWCIAEQEVGGRQCTVEGYVHRGRVSVYGTVDSVRTPNRASFARYEYPSTLPARIRARMVDVVERVVTALGYDDAPFNAELFWDPRRDRIWLLEVNARQSQSHADLFEKVDGRSNHEAMVALALGRAPAMADGVGEHRVAAKCFLHHPRDGRVTRVPSAGEIAAVEARNPGTSIHIAVRPGQRLSELPDQDSYSYELGVVFVGARSHRALMRTYRAVVAELALEVDDLPAPAETVAVDVPAPVPDHRRPADPGDLDGLGYAGDLARVAGGGATGPLDTRAVTGLAGRPTLADLRAPAGASPPVGPPALADLLPMGEIARERVGQQQLDTAPG